MTPREVTPPPEPPKFPLGSLIAGAILGLSGAALTAQFAQHPSGEHRWTIVGAAVVLVVLALELLLKVTAGRWIAVAAAVLVAAVASEAMIRERLPELVRDPLPPPVRSYVRHVLGDLQPPRVFSLLGFDVGCVLLIVGRPRVARIVVGAALAAPLIVLELMAVLGH